MDILKRSIAPLTENAWENIDNQARRVLHANLSARKFVDVSVPKGWDFASVPTGRLDVSAGQKGDEVKYGVHVVQPLVETRFSFSLNIWELDNIERGVKDIQFAELDMAMKKISHFEENAIYNGFKKGGIKGLNDCNKYNEILLGNDKKQILDGVSNGITTLLDASVEGPYVLVVNPDLWRSITQLAEGYPIRKHLEKLLENDVIYSQAIDCAYLVSLRGGDLELTIGADYSIGYESHTKESVNLFVAESFTFRVLDESAYLKFKLK
jgi:uncharacterized linocin/CFP29 family protein